MNRRILNESGANTGLSYRYTTICTDFIKRELRALRDIMNSFEDVVASTLIISTL